MDHRRKSRRGSRIEDRDPRRLPRSSILDPRWSGSPTRRRAGKILVLLAVLLPALVAMLGLVIDGSLLMSDYRHLQHVTDAGATAAAYEIYRGESDSFVAQKAVDYVHDRNGLTDAAVTVNIPPVEGPYAGQAKHVEVIAARNRPLHFLGPLGPSTIRCRAVAGLRPSTAGAAVVVLDPQPESISVAPLNATLSTLPSIVAGLEAYGLERVFVNGAVLVNTEFGGVDENGDPVGNTAPPPYGVACVPGLGVFKLLADDIRVVGGVDDKDNYGNVTAGGPNPLTAGRLPVPDPLLSLPTPKVTTDPNNVTDIQYGSVQVIDPLAPPVTLNPGIYKWIEILAGDVTFNPGVYIVRDVNSVTKLAVNITGGKVTADGVMFYITNTPTYNSSGSNSDDTDGSAEPAAPASLTLTPSVLITLDAPGRVFSPLNDPGSPFHGLMIFQRRHDRRPIVVEQGALGDPAWFSGNVYTKWGHVVLIGFGTYDASFVAGTVRFVTDLGITLEPTTLLPPAEDVFLVE